MSGSVDRRILIATFARISRSWARHTIAFPPSPIFSRRMNLSPGMVSGGGVDAAFAVMPRGPLLKGRVLTSDAGSR
jgi:hypothetical protein